MRALLILIALASAPSAWARDNVSSAAHRREVSYSVFAHPLTFTDHSSGSGIGVGFKLDQDLWVEGVHFEGRDYAESDDKRADTHRQESFEVVRLKAYAGNSLYVEAGLAERGLPGRRSRGAVFGLGNQWQWRSFTLGGEWFGVYHPLLALKTSPNGTKSETPLYDAPLFMGLTLGWAF